MSGVLGKSVSDPLTQGDIDSIKTLYLADMGLEDLSELARIHWQGLESLTISGNSLSSAPTLDMPQLSYLDMSDNHLTDISGIYGLLSLKTLIISGNAIMEISDLSGLSSLQALDLSYNRLEAAPELKSETLRFLDISANPIKKLPDSFPDCPALETLILPEVYEGSWLRPILAGTIILILTGAGICLTRYSENQKRKTMTLGDN